MHYQINYNYFINYSHVNADVAYLTIFNAIEANATVRRRSKVSVSGILIP